MEVPMMAKEAMVVAASSGIKDKKKLLKHLYENPEKLAEKLIKFMQSNEGEALPMVKLKGEGQGYYLSLNDKKLIRVSRSGEFYLLPWKHKNNKDRCYIYTHYNWMTGCIFDVFWNDIYFIGDN